MLAVSDNLAQCFSALRGHKLRASLTALGLTMGVATLITVMTIVQGANLYVEQKIANLGTNVFQIARTPFAVTDFDIVIKALKFKKLELADMTAIAEGCSACQEVGATMSTSVRARSGDKELQDVSLYGQFLRRVLDILAGIKSLGNGADGFAQRFAIAPGCAATGRARRPARRRR